MIAFIAALLSTVVSSLLSGCVRRAPHVNNVATRLQGEGLERPPLFHLSKSRQPASGAAPATHTACVSGVDWYHIDTGLFVSASRDGTAKLWDPNATAAVSSFDVAAPAHAVAAAPAAGMANLIAVASSASCVRLFDISSGSPTQTLAGTRPWRTTLPASLSMLPKPCIEQHGTSCPCAILIGLCSAALACLLTQILQNMNIGG